MKFILAAAGVAVASGLASPELAMQAQFSQFVKDYAKEYSTEEVFERYAVFKANVEKINAHNALGESWTMGVNEFADMTWEEFHDKYTGYRHVQSDFLRSLNAPAPAAADFVPADAKDWRSLGAVTPVKNQGQCGSCWSFSAVASTEGVTFLKTGTLTSFSEQQLVDCSTAQGNMGCNGGLMDYAFEYYLKEKKICTEAEYPYIAADGTCQDTKCTTPVVITSYKDVPKTETDLMTAIQLNPVSVAIEADQSGFQFYKGGVFSGACGQQLDHGVTLVGYGTDGKDYWIVKNSWGASWGEQGYIRMVRGQDQCGIANSASYPVA